MIPINLVLKNFMSYKNLDIDFSEIHVACLSGENGSGKSSILDSITWCLWDKARSASNEDLIRLGESEMSAELIFSLENQVYRILRSTKKAGGKKSPQTNLEFQVQSENGYKSLTGKTIKETQNRITESVKMDYQTFVNSAFILQGKADEFTTKSPIERKRVLSEILNLNQYDYLQEKAKEKFKEIEVEKAQNQIDSQKLKELMLDEDALIEKIKFTENAVFKTEDNLKEIEKNLLELSGQKEVVTNDLSVLLQVKKTYVNNKNTLSNLQKDTKSLSDNLTEQEKIISEKDEIEENFDKLNKLKKNEDEMSTKLMKFSDIDKNIHIKRDEINKEKHLLELELQKYEEKLSQYLKEKSELEKIIKDKAKITDAFEKLKIAREEESEYQKKSNLAQNLSEKKHKFEKKLQEEIHTIKITENSLKTKINERKNKISIQKTLEDKAKELNEKLAEFDKSVTYRDDLKDRGTKLSTIVENDKNVIIDKKQQIALYENKITQWTEVKDAHCPMCNTFLDEEDKKKIVEKYHQDIDLLDNEIKTLEHEIGNFTKQMDEYRESYIKTTAELKGRDIVQKQMGEVEQQLESCREAEKEISELSEKLYLLEEKLKQNDINPALQKELNDVSKQLEELEYNPEKLSVLQAKVNDWKWSELRYSQLEQSEGKLLEIDEKLPETEKITLDLKESISKNLFAIDKEKLLKELQEELKKLDYKKDEHQVLKTEINQLKIYEKKWNDLQQAVTRSQSLKSEIERLNINRERLEKEISEELKQIEKIPDLEKELFEIVKLIEGKNNELSSLKKEENLLKTSLIKDTEKLKQFEFFKQEIKEKETQFSVLEYESKLYKELVTAFGKNGIQAIIIENAIPEIEQDSNLLLSRITEGRMNVSFKTRRENKSSDKISETLEIFISDELGTRNYEMYSGGEAFRVNFAIRLALSKLLARRAGTRLRTLVIDEGFGTQDAKGISRLIEAINTVSGDFEKILIVTHMNELKEAFPSKIEVFKNIHGSEVKVFS